MRWLLIFLPFLLFCQQFSPPSYSHIPEFKEPKIKIFPLYVPSPYKLSYDLNISPYAGGEDLLFAHRLVERLEIAILQKNLVAYSKAPYAKLWRLSELVSVWMPLNYLASVVQHEVFGHGYRIRDIGSPRAKVKGYSFNVPLPYGPGGAVTSYKISENLTTTQEGAIAIAGVEATAILAQLTKLKWLYGKKVDPQQALLYLFSQQDLTLYISSLKIKDQDFSGHDIQGYLRALNYTYPDNILSKGRLRSLSWINLADPFTYYAIFAWLHYVWSGKMSKLPMIGSIYLPGLRLGLTPFGPEVFLESYLLYKRSPIYFYLKGGHHAKNRYYGVGIFAPNLYRLWKFNFGIRLDLWRQPKLLLQPAETSLSDIDFNLRPTPENPLYPARIRKKWRVGGAGSLITSLKMYKQMGLEAELGYKAQGFLPGYSLKAFPTIRLSYFMNL